MLAFRGVIIEEKRAAMNDNDVKGMDQSNGYEQVASMFIKRRGIDVDGVGASTVRRWSKGLSPGASVLDLGCGTGIPISKVLMDAGMNLHGIDASPMMVETFRRNFPNIPVLCEAVEDSLFFNRKFDVIIAWGLIFLLPERTQATVIAKAADALAIGGKLLFTSPAMKLEWTDVMTRRRSVSLGSEKYKELLSASGLSLVDEFEDEGENHYYDAVRLNEF